ncbi:MAG: dihydropteroate synthase [Oscillatoriales cyanobacterium RM1_1_9]|nr:dihydropteroate synthase [Oscillatoriales cyanobacterium RM2_1_1]NJO71772.1 dihydropteroate synthase [Oscillatoriales cyanobacterium RM1_1_9]
MGILNVTPDSFSDGGRFNTVEAALNQIEQMAIAGADIIDIGGQSTRPGAEIISLTEELNRVIPIIEALRNQSHPWAQLPISVDTTVAKVAAAAIAAGADLVNDISGATYDPQMLSTVGESGVPLILMHLRGTPKTMQTLTDYQDLMGEISQFLQGRIQACGASGIDPHQIIIDPGIGFAKTPGQNLEILRQLATLKELNCPILVGPSRKSFIGHILNQPDPQQRVWGTAAACVSAIAHGADILRVHDVKAMVEVCRVADAIYRFDQAS